MVSKRTEESHPAHQPNEMYLIGENVIVKQFALHFLISGFFCVAGFVFGCLAGDDASLLAKSEEEQVWLFSHHRTEPESMTCVLKRRRRRIRHQTAP